MEPYITTVYHFVKKIQEDWCVNLASALAYSMITVLFPVLAGGIALIISIINKLDIQSKNAILHQTYLLFPNLIISHAAIATLVAKISKDTGIIVLFSFLIALFAGSRFCILLENCFDIVYGVPRRDMIKQNALAVVESLVFFIIFPFLLLATTIPSVITHTVAPAAHFSMFFAAGPILIRGIIVFLLFCVIYMVIPNRQDTIKTTWKGALFSALLCELLFEVFPLYATHFLRGYTGTIGFIVIILIFFYCFCFILLIGAEINAFLEGHQVSSSNDPLPHPWMRIFKK